MTTLPVTEEQVRRAIGRARDHGERMLEAKLCLLLSDVVNGTADSALAQMMLRGNLNLFLAGLK